MDTNLGSREPAQDLLCMRCPRFGPKNLGLCMNCYSMYNRLRRTKYRYAESFTVEMYCKMHPVRVSRERANNLARDHAPKLVPGFYLVSPVMRAVAERVRKLAISDISVMIEGETGVGKEGVAAAIHKLGNRAKQPFVAVNCAALPEGLIESELFGHVRGSYTGSSGSSAGLFGSAHTGILFLDEVNSLPLSVQGKLLRVLDTRRVRPVGGVREEVVDVRVVAATNMNLEELCAKGTFRNDLYHRLAGVVVMVPPLRDQKEEIPLLMRLLLQQVAKRPIAISDRAMEYFIRYPWPGNVREMKNVVNELALFFEGDCIDSEDVPAKIKRSVVEIRSRRISARESQGSVLQVVPK